MFNHQLGSEQVAETDPSHSGRIGVVHATVRGRAGCYEAAGVSTDARHEWSFYVGERVIKKFTTKNKIVPRHELQPGACRKPSMPSVVRRCTDYSRTSRRIATVIGASRFSRR